MQCCYQDQTFQDHDQDWNVQDQDQDQKTWPFPTKLMQRLKDRDTNTIIPNLYPVTKMYNMLVKYSA